MIDPRAIVFSVERDRLPSGMTLDEFERATSGFEFLPVIVGGECVGAIMRRGSELHAAVVPTARGKWFGRRAMAVITDTVIRFGMATTAVPDGQDVGNAFALRLGFERTGTGQGVTFYKKAK